MLTTKRKPASVGEILTEEFMVPLGLTQAALAEAMGVPRKRVNELCNDSRGVTAATALILARVFGNTPDFWLNTQRRSDLWRAMHDPKERESIERARPLEVARGVLPTWTRPLSGARLPEQAAVQEVAEPDDLAVGAEAPEVDLEVGGHLAGRLVAELELGRDGDPVAAGEEFLRLEPDHVVVSEGDEELGHRVAADPRRVEGRRRHPPI